MTEKIVGLTSEQVEKSLKLYGNNSLVKEKSKSFARRFFENLSDPIIKILLIALAVQVALTFGNINYVEIAGILVAIFISTTVSTVSEYKSEQAFEKLDADSKNSLVSVLRDGEIQQILSSQLVVGDVMYVYAGDKIQADGTVISGKLSVDQSALNGESAECIKTAGRQISWDLSCEHKVFRGSIVTSGSAVVEVGRVGGETYYGMVAKDVQTETRESPLKLRLGRLAGQISKIGYVMAFIVGVAFLFNAFIVDNGFSAARIAMYFKDYKQVFATVIHALTLMITVVVVAAPEGLPMMITVVLSANMKKMLYDSILVKKLVGIETAGSMNILFTDKTGTITEGKPECTRIITAKGIYTSASALRKAEPLSKYLSVSARYNTDVLESGGKLTGGNATDRAIYTFFNKSCVYNADVLNKQPFSSDKKYSAVTLSDGTTIFKGGAEMLLAASEYCMLSDGSCDSFAVHKDYFYKQYSEAASRGERVLAVAISATANVSRLTLVALLVMKDKIRKGVRQAVRDVTGAGIQIVMITGDSKDTAVAIATESGIMNERADHVALDSSELSKMTDDEIKGILPSVRVVARALPQDKTRLVRLAQELDLVSGMTGDGINDAPSLKLADVGFSMGSGTDIAKSASDIVIIDDSFSAISKTVLYGRTIFKSIRKFITFQLIMNLVACGVSLVGQFIGIDTPITIIQMLWVNIIMDTLGGLAFSGEPPLPYYMKEKPKRRDEPILSADMLGQILVCGVFTLILCVLFLTSPVLRRFYTSETEFYTAFYALFIFAGIFNCFIARCERMWILSNIGKNRPFVAIMLAISVIQIFMIYYGGTAFRCTPLAAKQLLISISLAFTVIPFDLICRVAKKLK